MNKATIFIIVIVILGGGYFVFTSSDDEDTLGLDTNINENINEESNLIEGGVTDSKTETNTNTYEVAECGVTFEYDLAWEVREIAGSVADNIMVVIERPEPITSSGIVNINIPHKNLTVTEAIQEQECRKCEFAEPEESERNGIKVTELYVKPRAGEERLPGVFFFKQNNRVCSIKDEAAPNEVEIILNSLKAIVN